jgi:hypothetical protein
MARKHSSQFKYDGHHADRSPLRITRADLATLRLLNPQLYTYLPSNWINAFIGGNPFRFAKRLARLARYRHQLDGSGQIIPDAALEPPYLLRRQEFCRHAIYSRTERADYLLGETPPPRGKQPFAHQLLQDMVQASIDLGVRAHPDFQLVTWPTLREHGWTELSVQQCVPDRTLRLQDPHLIKLRNGHSRADGAPFLLKHVTGYQLFVLGKEIDRSTEPLTGPNTRRSIKEKFEHYQEIFDNKLYRTHYGFPNSIVLFYTISEGRMLSILRLAEEFFGSCAYIVFYNWKDWANEPSYPPASGELFTTSGKRANCPDFWLDTFWQN